MLIFQKIWNSLGNRHAFFFKDLDSRVFARRALCVFVVIFVTPTCIADTERTRRH
jgi:hypothetical protein